MNGIRLSHLLVAVGLLGLMIALMATLLIFPEIQARRLLCATSIECGTWTSIPGGRDILIVLVVTYLVPTLTLVAGALGLPTNQPNRRPPARESAAVRRYREMAADERERRGEEQRESED